MSVSGLSCPSLMFPDSRRIRRSVADTRPPCGMSVWSNTPAYSCFGTKLSQPNHNSCFFGFDAHLCNHVHMGMAWCLLYHLCIQLCRVLYYPFATCHETRSFHYVWGEIGSLVTVIPAPPSCCLPAATACWLLWLVPPESKEFLGKAAWLSTLTLCLEAMPYR